MNLDKLAHKILTTLFLNNKVFFPMLIASVLLPLGFGLAVSTGCSSPASGYTLPDEIPPPEEEKNWQVTIYSNNGDILHQFECTRFTWYNNKWRPIEIKDDDDNVVGFIFNDRIVATLKQ